MNSFCEPATKATCCSFFPVKAKVGSRARRGVHGRIFPASDGLTDPPPGASVNVLYFPMGDEIH